MIPSSLELNSDEFPFFSHLFSRSGSREKLGKSSVENRDHHHWPAGERERLAVEPTLENINYKRSSLLQTIMLDDDYHNFYQSPQKKKLPENHFFGGYYQKLL